MPKASSTERASRTGPSAQEIFTDRVSEQELLARLIAPHLEGAAIDSRDFLTVFYGVGGVGKSTLCRKAVQSAAEDYPGVNVVVLNLDFGKWIPESPFAHLLAVLVPELIAAGIPTPLTQTLLLMYSQADTGAVVTESAGGLWAGAVAVLDQGAGAVGIPGIGLLVEGAQWLRDRKRQTDTTRRLRELGLWPGDLANGRADMLGLEGKLANALYEDLKEWAKPGRNLRILLDGFERIQGRQRKQDCQHRLQVFAGYFAAAADPALKARVRLLVFGRERLRWDELYDDESWNECWNQHLLAGLAEPDARDFLDSYAEWLSNHGQTTAANLVRTSTAAILDAADERTGAERRIYPYYLDLATDMVRRAAEEGRPPDLGKTPGELQDRFFRYLPDNERHLLKILALAETFDAPLFDALVRDQRIAGYAVGTYLGSVADGRSYVSDATGSGHRLHRLMENSLQDLWLKSEAERQQGRETVQWLLDHLKNRMGGKERKDWDEQCVELWRRGVEIIVTQGPERELLDMQEWQELFKQDQWEMEYPISFELQLGFRERILECLEVKLGAEHPHTLWSVDHIGLLLQDMGNLADAEVLNRRALKARERTLGLEHPDTLLSVNNLGKVLNAKGDLACAEAMYRRALEGQEKIYGPEHPHTLVSVNNLGVLLSDKGDLAGAETLYRRALEGQEKIYGPEHPHTLVSVNNLGVLLSEKGDLAGAEALHRRALEAREKNLGPGHPDTILSLNNLGNVLNGKGDLIGAEALHRRALEIREKTLGQMHTDTLSSVSNLGCLLRDMGDLTGAEALYGRALEAREKTLGPEHPDTLSSVNNLGVLLSDKGDLEGAEALHRKALEAREKNLGLGHPDTIASLNNLGRLLCEKGDLAGAEALYCKALEAREKALGPGHPYTISSVNNLGNLLCKKGDLAGAEALYRKALDAEEQTLGPQHPDTLSSVNNLGVLLSEKGDLTGAEALYRRALEGQEKICGPGHPHTLVSVNNLGNLLCSKGDLSGAEELHRSALEARKMTLGPEHPDTLDSLFSLGFYLNQLNRRCEALALLRSSYERSDRCAQAVRYNLACYECLEGNIEEVKRLIAEELSEHPDPAERKNEMLADSDFDAIRVWLEAFELEGKSESGAG